MRLRTARDSSIFVKHLKAVSTINLASWSVMVSEKLLAVSNNSLACASNTSPKEECVKNSFLNSGMMLNQVSNSILSISVN